MSELWHLVSLVFKQEITTKELRGWFCYCVVGSKPPRGLGQAWHTPVESKSQPFHCITLLELVSPCNSNAYKTRIILQKVGSLVNLRIIYPDSLAVHLGIYIL